MMNQEIKAQWVTALRSGEYEQTQGQLRDRLGHCCLGVLCEVAVKAGVIETYNDTASLPPNAVIARAGLEDSDPWVESEDGHRARITALNDCDHRSFDHIADAIEAQL